MFKLSLGACEVNKFTCHFKSGSETLPNESLTTMDIQHIYTYIKKVEKQNNPNLFLCKSQR